MNDAAKQKPQTPPRRLHTRGNPQIQGYTDELSLIDDLFIVRFAGRMRRAEYWSKLILLSLLLVVLAHLGWLVLGENIVLFILFIIICILTCPYLALVTMGMTVRRLHDVGFSGWVMLFIMPITMVTSFIASKLTDLTSFAPTPTNSLTYEVVGRVSFFCLLFLFNLLFAAPLLSNSDPRKNKYGINPREDVRGRTVTSEPPPTKGSFTVRFAGRMCRAEYWSKIIPLTLLSCFLSSLEWSALGDNIVLFVMIYVLTVLPLGVVMMGMTSRRLHDAGFSGWMMLWIVIPSIFFIAPMLSNPFTSREDVLNRVGLVPVLFYAFFLMLLLLDSEPGENKYGPNLGGAEVADVADSESGENKYGPNLGGAKVADVADSESGENEYGPNPKENVCGRTVTSEPSFIAGLFIVRFAGRMRRQYFWLSQFILWPLICALRFVGLGTIAALFLGGGEFRVPLMLLVITLFLMDGYFGLVGLGMQVRRLHDIGMSGKYLLGIIIFVGIVFVLSVGVNRYLLLGNASIDDLNGAMTFQSVLSVLSALVSVILIVLFCRDSQYGANKWGQNPKGQGNTQKTEGAEKYRLAVEQGNAGAQYALGWCYYHGNGVKINPTEAAEWFRLAAEQGHAKAQFKLGECYVSGKGVNKDLTEAVRWYRLAAEQGLADAQYNLGVCYANGYGVNKDPTEAVRWYRLAAKQENAMAQNKLGMCYYNGEGVDKDYAEALVWYRRAADKGLSGAMYELGKCYLDGIGTEKAEEQAKYWLQKAADNGNTDASELLHHARTTRELPTKKPKTILFLIVGIISVTLLWLLCVHGREDAPNTASVDDAVQMLKECGILDQYASGKLVTSVSSGIGKEHRRNPIEAISEEFLYHFMMYKDGKENLSEYPYIDKIFELYQRANAEQQEKQVSIPRKLPVQCLEAFAAAGVKIANYPECRDNILAIDPPDPKLVTFLYTQCAKTSPNQVNVAEANGWTPLMFAARYSTADACRLLIQAGAKVDKKNNDFTTALMLATCNTENPDVCGVLLDAGASVHAKDKDGWTPLTWAARHSRAAVCERLIKLGADVNAKEDDGWTPLMYAARYSTADVCRLLIQAGAKVYEKNNNGETARMLAFLNTEHPDVWKFL